MNTAILRKIAEELNKQDPRLDYVRGMIETLIEMGEPILTTSSQYVPHTFTDAQATGKITASVPTAHDPEAVMLNGMAAARLQQTKDLVAKSLET